MTTYKLFKNYALTGAVVLIAAVALMPLKVLAAGSCATLDYDTWKVAFADSDVDLKLLRLHVEERLLNAAVTVEPEMRSKVHATTEATFKFLDESAKLSSLSSFSYESFGLRSDAMFQHRKGAEMTGAESILSARRMVARLEASLPKDENLTPEMDKAVALTRTLIKQFQKTTHPLLVHYNCANEQEAAKSASQGIIVQQADNKPAGSKTGTSDNMDGLTVCSDKPSKEILYMLSPEEIDKIQSSGANSNATMSTSANGGN